VVQLAARAGAPNQVHGLVSYYGFGETEAGKALPPILGRYAEDDEFEALADVRSTEQKLIESGGVAQFHVYPGAKHWLDEPFADAPNSSLLTAREA
jgi:dienelactone hydrolase